MRFIDVNVFLYVVIKLKGEVFFLVLEWKKKVREIFIRIENGEEVVIIVVYFSEVVNIFEVKLNLIIVFEFIEDFLIVENVIVFFVVIEDYFKVIFIVWDKGVSVNDVLVCLKMREFDINEIYIFDRYFLNFDVKIVEE